MLPLQGGRLDVGCPLLPQYLLHRLAFCELIDQLVEIPYFLHQWIFYFFHANTAHHAFDQRTVRMDMRGLSKESFEIVFFFYLPP